MGDDRILGRFVQSLFAVFLVVGAFVFQSHATLAKEFDWPKFYDLWEQEKWDEAWEVVEGTDGTKDITIFSIRGILLGSGKLSTGRDRCDAALQFEQAIEHGAAWVYAYLDTLYAGDWMTLAAMEGSRSALFHLSLRVYYNGKDGKGLYAFDKGKEGKTSVTHNNLRALKDSAPFLYLAAQLGYERAQKRIELLSRWHPEIYNLEHEDAEIPWGEYKRVFCPVRIYDSESGN